MTSEYLPSPPVGMPPRGGAHHAKAMKAKRRHQQEECKRKKEEEQQLQVDRYMKEYDKDGSGVLDKEEFTTLLKAVFASYADAINGDVIDKLIKSCESQGGITKENISRVIRKYAAFLKEMAAAATARESIFNRFDADGDGTISKQEMLPILKRDSEPPVTLERCRLVGESSHCGTRVVTLWA